ncbi:MAG: LamG domain-containing protein, partial [Candidatus Marinimicrobia bacterium]|nr:LamG domain-containing protein [Candidatus Neomarinimicrobiota bacterium]
IAVHGTLDVTAVATGADLLAISGFGVSDYGEQPYNADLNFADGVFTFECWIKTTDSDGGSNVIFERSDGTLNGVIRAYTVDGYFGIYTAEGGAASFFRGGPVISDGNWHHVVGVQDLSGLTVYIDSVAGASVSESAASTIRDIDNTSAISRIGTYKYVTGTAVFEGSLTLPRITGTALSAAEVKRHYNSERPLFNENAACTLVGNSDAITALDHDAETDLLHVGTSGGRSTFQGLVRTGEDTATTSQSLTAISAKDKIILEGK